MKFQIVEDTESLYIEKGKDTLQEDIDDFIKFIWRHAEARGLVIKNKERYQNEGNEVDRNRKGDVQPNGMGEGN
jgi:erythromycin esterase-like protein|tara:strand:- start:809 stop:1030 length:222 start_codon:yes stop_codon:yes gene_type:complete